ncbi:MAG: hypothetical protein MKZ98_09185, partial [Pseudomonadales bacterium]|nr:hypothetical protein [Pseudomonadales bacterium]
MASIAQGLVIGDLLLFSSLRVARENAIEHVVPASDSDLSTADNDGIGERLKQRRVGGAPNVEV